jgi:hypothetical protein
MFAIIYLALVPWFHSFQALSPTVPSLNIWEIWPDFQDPMDPGKDDSKRLKLGTAFLYSATILCMHYLQRVRQERGKL